MVLIILSVENVLLPMFLLFNIFCGNPDIFFLDYLIKKVRKKSIDLK